MFLQKLAVTGATNIFHGNETSASARRGGGTFRLTQMIVRCDVAELARRGLPVADIDHVFQEKSVGVQIEVRGLNTRAVRPVKSAVFRRAAGTRRFSTPGR